jgi:enoyl-CoA hydratase/carnithine racemase
MLEGEARKLAERCGKAPGDTARAIRRMLIRSRGATLSEQLTFEAAEQAKAVATDGFKDRLAAALKPKRS